MPLRGAASATSATMAATSSAAKGWNRPGLDLRNRYAKKGGFSAVVIKLRLPDGQIYGRDGTLDYASPTVAENTDTITVHGVIPISAWLY
jgi:hypothetical protein